MQKAAIVQKGRTKRKRSERNAKERKGKFKKRTLHLGDIPVKRLILDESKNIKQ